MQPLAEGEVVIEYTGEVISWREALRRHGLHSVLAVGWVAAILASGAHFPWWLSPVIAGLLLAVPLSAWGSRSAPGRWLRKRGIFMIPEEVREPHVLREARRRARGGSSRVRRRSWSG